MNATAAQGGIEAETRCPASLARLVAETTHALARCVREDGLLFDPEAGAPTPPDHYGTTFAALALAVAEPADPRWPKLLARWRPSRPAARGHGPFNRLALLLLAEQLERGRGARRAQAAPGEVDSIRELKLRAWRSARACGRLRRHPSNNWLMLERACDVLESAWLIAPSRRAGRLRWAERRFDACCSRWLTPGGGFVDYPARLRGGPVAAPLCYHAKCAAVLALVCHGSPSHTRERQLAKAGRWLVELVDERSGHFGGHGRSGHSLFGTACALFVSLDAMARSGNGQERAAHARRIDALCCTLEAGRREDGLLSLTPSGAAGSAGGWDSYMRLSVYNAWAAGLLGWLCARLVDAPPRELGAAPCIAAPNASFVDPVSGVAACRGERASVFLSLRGGVVQDFDAHDADLRSSGLQPFHASYQGRARLAPPLRVALSELRRSPPLAGFTPIFQLDEALYGLVRFEAVEVVADRGGRLLAWGWGAPQRLHDDPSRLRGVARRIDALDARLNASRLRRRRALAPPCLPGHLALRVFAFDGESGRFALATWLRGCLSRALWLNPLGHAWLGCATRSPITSLRVSGVALATPRTERLPGALPDAFGACAAATGWPAQDCVWTLEGHLDGSAAPAGSGRVGPLLELDLERRRLVTPWTSLALGELSAG